MPRKYPIGKIRYLFVILVALGVAGCTSALYWQNTQDLPKTQLVALTLSKGWRGRTYSLKIDGQEVPLENIERLYIRPGKHNIEEDARRVDRCIHRVHTTYIDRMGNTVKKTLECDQYSYTRRTRKGELNFEAGYEYNLLDFYVYLLPVVAGKEGGIERERAMSARKMRNYPKKPL